MIVEVQIRVVRLFSSLDAEAVDRLKSRMRILL